MPFITYHIYLLLAGRTNSIFVMKIMEIFKCIQPGLVHLSAAAGSVQSQFSLHHQSLLNIIQMIIWNNNKNEQERQEDYSLALFKVM